MVVNKLDDLFPGVAPYIANCPDAMIRAAIRWSWREFCALSLAWREHAVPVPFVQGEREYPVRIHGLDVDIRQVARIEQINAADEVMGIIRPDEFDTIFKGDGLLHVVVPFSPSEQHVAQRRVRSVCVLVPVGNDQGFEAVGLLRRYADAIEAGAKMHLYSMPNRPWSDRDSAEAERRQFMRRVVEAISEWTKQEERLIRV